MENDRFAISVTQARSLAVCAWYSIWSIVYYIIIALGVYLSEIKEYRISPYTSASLTWRWLVFLNNEGGTKLEFPIKQTMRRCSRTSVGHFHVVPLWCGTKQSIWIKGRRSYRRSSCVCIVNKMRDERKITSQTDCSLIQLYTLGWLLHFLSLAVYDCIGNRSQLTWS